MTSLPCSCGTKTEPTDLSVSNQVGSSRVSPVRTARNSILIEPQKASLHHCFQTCSQHHRGFLQFKVLPLLCQTRHVEAFRVRSFLCQTATWSPSVSSHDFDTPLLPPQLLERARPSRLPTRSVQVTRFSATRQCGAFDGAVCLSLIFLATTKARVSGFLAFPLHCKFVPLPLPFAYSFKAFPKFLHQTAAKCPRAPHFLQVSSLCLPSLRRCA